MNLNARIPGEIAQDEQRRPDRDPALGPPLAPAAFSPGAAGDPDEPETAVLAAITSGYENARARIISATPSSSGRHRAEPPPPVASPGWAPTVPVEIAYGLPRPQRDAQEPDAVAPPRRARDRWQELLRRLGTALGPPRP